MRTKTNEAEKIVDDVLIYDKPSNIRESLRLMFVAFFSGEEAPPDDTRMSVVFHYSVLDDFLKDLEGIKE